MPSFSFAATANAVRARRRDPGLRRHRPRLRSPRPGRRRRPRSPTDRGDHARAPLRPPGRDGPRSSAHRAEHGLPIIEDAAQAHARHRTAARSGSFGTVGVLQLLPHEEHDDRRGRDGRHAVRRGRPDGAAAAQPGHGAPVRERGRRLQHPDDRHRTPRSAGCSSTRLAGWTAQRQDNAAFLDANLPGSSTPPVAPGATHVYHQYTVRVPDDRDGLAPAPAPSAASAAASTTRRPIHRLPSFGLDPRPARHRARPPPRSLSLPVHPSLTDGRARAHRRGGEQDRQAGA